MNKDVDKYLTHHYPAFKGKDDYINFTYEGLYEMLVDFKKAVLPQANVIKSVCEHIWFSREYKGMPNQCGICGEYRK